MEISDYSYSKNIHGIRWGKYFNNFNNFIVLFEIIGKFDTLNIKNITIPTEKVYYFVYKERVSLYKNGLTNTEYIWVECEKEFIYDYLQSFVNC